MSDDSAARKLNPVSDWKSETGPLRTLINDTTVTEIMVNRWDRVYVERNGVIVESRHVFKDAESLATLVRSLAVWVGKELNRRSPYIDARLPDGSRLNLIIPPIALDGPAITIRKASATVMSYHDLLQMGALDEKAIFFLNRAVYAKQNIVVSGGTGTGKTTLLNVLSSFIGPQERVVTLEDTPELALNVRNVVRLETKQAAGTEPAITMEDLLRNALRMRPDRIVVGECRGAEAMDMLMAMNTGHEGSLTTVHANSAQDALRRLESMILRSGMEAPHSQVQMDIGNTIHFIVQLERSFDGRRRIVEILEVSGHNRQNYNTREIFNISKETKRLESTGEIPRFVQENKDIDLALSTEIFDPTVRVNLG